MKKRFCLFICLFLLLNLTFSSCIPERRSDFFELKYSKFACKGRCPVFELKIRQDQIVIFNGKEYTDIVGLVFIKLSDEKYKKLHEIIVESRFLEKKPILYKRPFDFPATELEIIRGYSDNRQIMYDEYSLNLDKLIKFLDELVFEVQS